MLKGFRRNSQPDVLTSGLAASSSDNSLVYSGISPGWAASTMVEIDSELILVRENDPANNTATVVRGWLGTTVAAHAANSPIYISPRILRSDILDLINDCLDDLYGRDLFAVGVAELTYGAMDALYEIPADASRILRIDAERDTMESFWAPVHDWYKMDNAPTGTGNAVVLRAALPQGCSLRVVYTKAFEPVELESDDLEAVSGIKTYMVDPIFYFAMNRIMVSEEIKRSQIQSAQNHQRAADVPAFLSVRTGEWYQARYEDRVRSARKRLMDENRRVNVGGYGS